jgi:lysophospholipase L1-like esterase
MKTWLTLGWLATLLQPASSRLLAQPDTDEDDATPNSDGNSTAARQWLRVLGEAGTNPVLEQIEILRGWPDCHFPNNVSPPHTYWAYQRRLKCAALDKKKSQISVACVGDSITAGFGASSRNFTYPSQLQAMLGDRYVVSNFGSSGAMMQKGIHGWSYWNMPQFRAAVDSHPDIVILMLGTNDAKAFGGAWEQQGVEAHFTDSYKEMLSAFGPETKLYMAIPPPLYFPAFGMNLTIINKVYPTLLQKIRASAGLVYDPIDVFEATGGEQLRFPDFFRDGCHPTDAGYEAIAESVYNALKPTQGQPENRTTAIRLERRSKSQTGRLRSTVPLRRMGSHFDA